MATRETVMLSPGGMPFVVFGNQQNRSSYLARGWRYPAAPEAPEEEGGSEGESPEPEVPPVESVDESLINVNTASVAELTELPGIGLAKGALIVEGRPYADIQGLIALNLIGVNWLDLELLITF